MPRSPCPWTSECPWTSSAVADRLAVMIGGAGGNLIHLSCWADCRCVRLHQRRGREPFSVDEAEVAGAHRNDAFVGHRGLLQDSCSIQAHWHRGHQATYKYLSTRWHKVNMQLSARTPRTLPLTSTLSLACLSQALGTCTLKSQVSPLSAGERGGDVRSFHKLPSHGTERTCLPNTSSDFLMRG